MRIRTVLIGIGLAGNLLLALSLFFLFNYRDTTQKSFANESLVSTYEAAWFQTLETSIDAISAWLPITGERGTQCMQINDHTLPLMFDEFKIIV